MATYVVGDVQGCFKTLERLLDKINFDPQKDFLWFIGDLVNVGKNSLKALKWAYKNRDSCNLLIGNHELNLLCIAYGLAEPHDDDTLNDVLEHNKRDLWLDWVRTRPLIHEENDYFLVHAGVHPNWSLEETRNVAKHVEEALRGPDYLEYLTKWKKKFFKKWEEDLGEKKRVATALNIMTKMRFLDQDNHLVKNVKGELQNAPEDLTPWFRLLDSSFKNKKLLFGHWSAIGVHQEKNITGLDSGAVWGRVLTAYCLETGYISQMAAHKKDLPD